MTEKIEFLLRRILKSNKEDEWIYDLIQDCNFQVNTDYNREYHSNPYDLILLVNPEKFISYNQHIKSAEARIKDVVQVSTRLGIAKCQVSPDYDKIIMHNSVLEVVKTNWEEINENQAKLISLLNNSNQSLDYQNIGNTSRTIMDKLARIVFVPQKHIPSKPEVKVQNGMFKNQLHTYIMCTLGGSKNKELRKFSEKAVEFAETAIDLMNQTTHKIDVQKLFAEMCVMSTLSVITLIKAATEIEN